MKKLKQLLLLCLCFAMIGCSNTPQEENKEENKVVQKEDKKDEIKIKENDLYVSPLNPTKAQIKAYNELSEAIEKEDHKQEAKSLAISFVYDFFTLKNKEGRDDIGGLQFVPSKMIRSFYYYAQSYYYGNYPNIVNTYGKDSLPEVINVSVESCEEQDLEFNYNWYNGYEIKLKVEYAKSKVTSLKEDITIKLIRMNDYDYDREFDYLNDYMNYELEMNECYRILSLN